MKILWLTENYPPNRGGMAQSCDRIVFNLRKNNVEIHLLHLTQHSPQMKINVSQLGKDILFPVDTDLAHSFNCLYNFLEKYQQQENFSHLVAFGGYASMFFAPFLQKLLGIKLITLLRGNDFDAGLFNPRRKQVVEDCLLASAHICCVSSDKVKKINILYPHLRASYTPNGINLEQWQALPHDLEHATNWRKTHTKSNTKVLGLFGHLKEKKGALFLLENILKADLQDKIHLLIIGEIQKEMIDFLHLNPTLQYTHYEFIERYALLGYYPACDAVAIPSFYDGMPNVLLEAMGLGIPIFASKVAGMADVLNEDIALLFEVGNNESCVDTLQKFVAYPEEHLKIMGANSQENVLQNYTEHKEAMCYKEIFEKTLES
jgi:glycosyltransferase involved in cell wall biosynthesis